MAKEMKAQELARLKAEYEARQPRIGAPDRGYAPLENQRTTLPARVAAALPTGASRDAARMALHGLARTGNTILRAIDIPNRVFGNTRSVLQDIYERSEANLERDAYEDRGGATQVGETTVHLASAGVLGRALPAVFGVSVGADTYETAKYAGASEGEALAKGIGHGIVDTAIWTLGQGLASKYLPKAWQWLGRELTGATRGATSSITSDAVLNSLGADISGEEMAKRAAHAAWMVPLLGMLKMGGKRREEAMSLLKKARPDLAGAKADKVIETIEAEFSDPKSQKVALAWVARKGANLPDDTAQIRQALEVSSKVKGLDPMSRSPFEILSDPAYARYLPKPRPQDVKAFSNMKRYPMGVIGFDVSDDAAGRQATREMINAYMSPSSNPWCLATGKDAARLGELGPSAEGYWKGHSAVPKQIFFQEVDGRLELTAFRATSPGGEGRQEYWDTSDAGYSGIPIKMKVPGDPMGRYRKMVFRPAGQHAPDTVRLTPNGRTEYNEEQLREYIAGRRRNLEAFQARPENFAPDAVPSTLRDIELAEHGLETLARRKQGGADGKVQGTFEDIAPGKVFKGDPFRDGRSQTWVQNPLIQREQNYDPTIEIAPDVVRSALDRRYLTVDIDGLRTLRGQMEAEGASGELDVIDDTIEEVSDRISRARNRDPYVLTEDKVRTTENGITKFHTTKYETPVGYVSLNPGEQSKPVEIEESELVSPEWMRARGYDPENGADVHRMQRDLNIQAWGNGQEAAMAVVPTKRTYMQTQSGTPETVTYGPNGRDVVSVDFTKDGVPYRQENFQSGPVGLPRPSTLYHTIVPGDFPVPQYGFTAWAPSGSRLTRNPDSVSPEVLNEVKWDEKLGSFVRTSGNRRWSLVRTTLSGGQGQNDPNVFMSNQQVEIALREGRLNEHQAREINQLLNEAWWDDDYLVTFNSATGEITPGSGGLARADHRGTGFTERLLVEDRQPDGTWAPAETINIQASPSRANTLPPPPDEIPLQGGAGLQETLREAVPIEDPDLPDLDGDGIPFALKAGNTRRDVQVAAKGGNTRAASKGGDGSQPENIPPEPGGASVSSPVGGGPRIVINPTTFRNRKDALCVAVNEAFRIVMEETGFEPVSEPTEKQREFFSDTGYADDELQLRRTIIARICTFDTSVKDPTDEQLQESVEFLRSVLEAGYPQNEWEQSLVQKLLDILSHVPMGKRGETSEPEPGTGASGGGLETQGDVAGGIAGNVEREEERDLKAGGAVLENPKYDAQGVAAGPQADDEVPKDVEAQEHDDMKAGGAVLENPKYDAQGVAAGPQQDADVPPTVERQNEDNLRAGGAVLADPRHDAEGAEFDAERRRERQGV